MKSYAIFAPFKKQKMRKRLESLKKNAAAIREETQKEVEKIVDFSIRDRKNRGHLDLESLEVRIRHSMHRVGSIMLERLLNSDGGDYRGRTLPCEKGHDIEFKE